MDLSRFDTQFAAYLAQAKEAQAQARHHDYRRQLFLGFLHDAFGIEAADVDVEQYLQIAGKRVSAAGVARIRKGWIDAVFRDLIFEFKRDLAAEAAEGLRELRDYLSTLPNGTSCVGLLTDGLTFRAYVLDDTQPDGLRPTDSIDLSVAAPRVAYQWLDAYLLRQRNMPPSAADIVKRFGLSSPTFVAASRVLRDALRTFAAVEAGAFAVKRQQWAFHLARVYGTADVTTDELFIRHTYLCQFAKLLAYTARFGVGAALEEVEHIIDGKAFEVLGISNIGEQDFFAWVLASEVKAEVLAVFGSIVASFAVYDLGRINEDLLKQLYQSLVDPATRHELGEFYTPDWLAELTLREIRYTKGQSLLDPACGSGTFLFTALRLLTEQGLTGQELVDFALEHIMGVDVHPLAVTIAKLNYMLAILPHLEAAAPTTQDRRRLRTIPVAMANSLQTQSKSYRISVIEVAFGDEPGQVFQVPVEAASQPRELAEVLQEMGEVARRAAEPGQYRGFGDFGKAAVQKLSTTGDLQDVENARIAWTENARRLSKQIAAGRDSIWVYVLQNLSRPLYLRYRRFDVVVGNPPWLSYRYIQDKTYQRDIKELTQAYDLITAQDVKLFTQMELASLFFEHCRATYLQPGGTLAFVMPRSVITGAKQHQSFQRRGFARILDFKGVAPLFNTECCVLIRDGDLVYFEDIPTTRFTGALPAQECSWQVAKEVLLRSESISNILEPTDVASPYYHPRFKAGATLFPRNLVFVTSAQPGLAPGQLAHTPIMRTDPDVDAEAKVPWKGLSLQGYIDEEFLYATLLSKNLIPFGVRKLHLVALPVRVGTHTYITAVQGTSVAGALIPVSLSEMRSAYSMDGIGNPASKARTADEWFEPAEHLWAKHRKSEAMSLWQRLDYQRGLTAQSAVAGPVVIYNAAGSNLSACVIDVGVLPVVNGSVPKAFVAQHKTYWFRPGGWDECHYLAALLNAPCVDRAIKPFQTRGIYVGPRDIERRPFEVCAIPQFDAGNADHQQLAQLSQHAHRAVAELDLTDGGVVAARKKARQTAHEFIAQLDALAQRLLGLAATPEGYATDEREDEDEALDEVAEA